MNAFQRPMQPFLGLSRWSRLVQLLSSKMALFVYDTGAESKTTVVLLPGLGDEADTWRHVIPLLEGDYPVIAPDLPGFERSEKVGCNTPSRFSSTACWI